MVDARTGKVTRVLGPFAEGPPPADLANCRFELFPGPVGVVAIFASDYDAASRILNWLVGAALQQKDSVDDAEGPG